MKTKDFIYKHRATVKYVSILLFVVGLAITYFYYNSEPYETIGGFLCGIGFGLFLIFIAIKQTKNSN